MILKQTVDLIPLLYMIAFFVLGFLTVRFGNSEFAKNHIPYSIRKWISMDGFWEGFNYTNRSSTHRWKNRKGKK